MLSDKVIVVTGGGSGIGEGAAKVIAGYGAKVVIGDIDMMGADRVAAEIVAAGGNAIAHRCDIAKDDEVAALIAAATSRFGRLDGAFNNAGIPGRYLATIDLDKADWNRVLDIDLVGTWNCIRHEIAAIRATNGGKGAIVNNASNAAFTGVPTLAAYGAAKAGVVNLTKTVAVEHGPEGLRVNAICPGTIETPPVHASRAAGYDFTGQAQKAPLRRLGTMAEAGELVAWLLSDKASFITGQAISIDGGTSACF
ncbi:MAG: 3-oxoacyl-[acyl-carrier protein] reductase [Rhizorhabdus sp.]|nr:3-oxoacyl-[acyl-carrier protein] reductase [Rhizorhabdus sp.]